MKPLRSFVLRGTVIMVERSHSSLAGKGTKELLVRDNRSTFDNAALVPAAPDRLGSNNWLATLRNEDKGTESSIVSAAAQLCVFSRTFSSTPTKCMWATVRLVRGQNGNRCLRTHAHSSSSFISLNVHLATENESVLWNLTSPCHVFTPNQRLSWWFTLFVEVEMFDVLSLLTPHL